MQRGEKKTAMIGNIWMRTGEEMGTGMMQRGTGGGGGEEKQQKLMGDFDVRKLHHG